MPACWVREDFTFEDGLFSCYDAKNRMYHKTTWNYHFDQNGYAKCDVTLQDARCVWNLLKAHVSRYTPDVVENIRGTPQADFLQVCEFIAETSAHNKTAERPFPEHYEPFETPIGTNPLHPNVVSNPAARIFKDDLAALGSAEKFPYVGTTYRLTEHFHGWTKHARLNAIAQPQQFVEIGERLAAQKGIKQGDWVKVSSNRGYIKAKAVVTKRIRTLKVNGQDVDTIGIPIHWGFTGIAKKGYTANNLTPSVGDANSQTPEYKAFLVNVKKV